MTSTDPGGNGVFTEKDRQAPLMSVNGVWKGTEQISEKKSDCECDDCGQDPCIECGESHHSVKEAKVEAGRCDYGKASVRNKRKFGREGKPAVFDLPFSGGQSDRGKMIDQRRAEHKAKRGVKEGKGYQPEIEHSKLGDAKKKADKKRESKLPPHLQGDAIGKMKKAFSEEDKAFNYVLAKLKAKHGSGVMTKGDKMPEPSAAQKKKNAAIRAKRAKEDHRDPTEKASDGRYSDRYSNRGSD